jgi:alpha-amylase
MILFLKNILFIFGFFLYNQSPLISADWNHRTNKPIPMQGQGKKFDQKQEKTKTTPAPQQKINAPIAIYHAFNEEYTKITNDLKAIKDQGYTHIQISPAQKSRTTIPHTHQKGSQKIKDLWWLRYQPIDYTVLSNTNGTEEELTKLAFEANNLGLQIIGDLVFNYLAALPSLEASEWNSAFQNIHVYRYLLSHLQIYEGFSMALCMKDNHKKELYFNGNDEAYKECMEDFSSGTEEGGGEWYNGSCPKLRATKNVLKIHNNHIDALMKIGIKNFRFDAAKHLSDKAIGEYINHIKTSSGDTFNYFECVNDNSLSRYTGLGSITDYNYGYDVLGKVFSYNGDLKNLRNHQPLNENAILFAETHDTAERRKIGHAGKGVQEIINNQNDMLLAQAYILARNGGVPIILSSFRDDKFVKQGVKFRQILKVQSQFGHVSQKEQYVDISGIDPKVVMILMRDDGHGVFFMNKSDQPVTIHLDQLKLQKKYTIIPTENNNGKIEKNLVTENSILLPKGDVLYLISEECYEKYHKIS